MSADGNRSIFPPWDLAERTGAFPQSGLPEQTDPFPRSDLAGRGGAFGAVILGAGASSRMGRPKLLLPWGKTTIVGHLIGQWRELGARQIAVVCRPGDEGLANELDRLKFPASVRVVNMDAESGMFSSVVCAANWKGWEPAIGAWAIVLGDQPHLARQTLQTLLAFHQRHTDSICQPFYRGHGRHPVLLPRVAWEEVSRSKARTLKDFLRETSTPLLECPIDDPHLELDLDTPEDYTKLRRLTQTDRHGHE